MLKNLDAEPEIVTGPCELGPGVWVVESRLGGVSALHVYMRGQILAGDRAIRVGPIPTFPPPAPGPEGVDETANRAVEVIRTLRAEVERLRAELAAGKQHLAEPSDQIANELRRIAMHYVSAGPHLNDAAIQRLGVELAAAKGASE